MSISNCGSDENGKYTGGTAGDQTGKEWQIRSWYNRPWKCVLRYPDASVRELIASMAEDAANNDKIGYDQGQRTTFWTQLEAAKYYPSKITTACEADCSSGVAAIVKAVGYRLGLSKLQNVSKDAYTGNMRSALKTAGFTVLTDSKYLNSENYLLRGDILLNDSAHVATNVTDGKYASSESEYVASSSSSSSNNSTTSSSSSSSSPSKTVQFTGTINTKTTPRKWAGTSYSALSSVSSLAKGTSVSVCDTVNDSSGTPWYYVLISSKYYGFVPAANVTKDSTTTSSSSSSSSSSGTTLNKTVKWNGKVTGVSSVLNVRSYAGTEYSNIKSYPYLKNGNAVGVCDELNAKDGSKWYYILIASKYYGFVSASYITKA